MGDKIKVTTIYRNHFDEVFSFVEYSWAKIKSFLHRNDGKTIFIQEGVRGTTEKRGRKSRSSCKILHFISHNLLTNNFQVFEEFVATFQESPISSSSKVWVKAGTYDAGARSKGFLGN